MLDHRVGPRVFVGTEAQPWGRVLRESARTRTPWQSRKSVYSYKMQAIVSEA